MCVRKLFDEVVEDGEEEGRGLGRVTPGEEGEVDGGAVDLGPLGLWMKRKQ